MISKSDWQDAHEVHLEEGRKRLGPPPEIDEIEALFEGRLSDADAERVRELLVYYPDLARAMTMPFPESGAGVLTAEELAEDREKLLARVRPPKPPLPFPNRRSFLYAAAAAGLAVVIASVVLYRTGREMHGTPVLLSADGQLSGTPQTPHQLSTETDYILKPAFRPERAFRAYRLELVDLSAAAPRSLKTWNDVEPASDGSFPVELSTKGFAEGLYALVLYGVDHDAPARLATYTIRLSAP